MTFTVLRQWIEEEKGMGESDAVQKKYPKVYSVVCHYKGKHAYKGGSGWFSTGFIRQGRANFSFSPVYCSTFACCMTHLGEHHARDRHEWEGGHCEFHP